MLSARFDYDLPGDAIAQTPVQPRDASRLLDASRGCDPDVVVHRRTTDLPDLLGPGDVVVLNDTQVIPARLTLRKPTGASIEVLALAPLRPVPGTASDDASEVGWWEALVRPSRRVPAGTVLETPEGVAVLEIGDATGDGTRRVRAVDGDLPALLDRSGEVPLPPYITEALDDIGRYQTVYASLGDGAAGSVAAPTAGLHLTEAVLERCRAAGATVVTVVLEVGIGTFRPLESDTLDEHRMHRERYRVTPEVWATIMSARRVVAVGTTVVRTLESVASTGALEGDTGLFIRPGHHFSVVDALMTNFHLPRSTLLVMLEAFIGPGWRDLYALALAEGYRFLSFGDAMFCTRSPGGGGTEAAGPVEEDS